MASSELDFDIELNDVERQTLLMEAADRLDGLQGSLGPGSEGGETPEGRIMRQLAQEKAGFGGFPKLYRVTDKYFTSENRDVPYSFKQMSLKYRFYWLDLPLDLYPESNWAFNQLKVFIEFNSGTPEDGTRPTSYQILPDQAFQTLLELKGHFEVGLDANFKLSAKTDTIGGQLGPAEASVGGGGSAEVSGGVGMSIPPYVYSLKQAKIIHSSIDLSHVKWTLNGHGFFQENKPRLSVIIQMLKDKKELKISAAMQASRFINLASPKLQALIKELPRPFREFLEKGIPKNDVRPDDDPWDLAAFL